MARRARPHWCKRDQVWRTEVGGRSKRFPGIARDDHAGIAVAFAAYLEGLALAARPPRPTVYELAVRFVDAPRGVRPKTVDSNRGRLIKWCEWPSKQDPGQIGLRPADELKAADLTKPLAAWKAAGLSDHYRAGICQAVKAAFSWAASEDGGRLIPSNPFSEVKVPSVARSPERYATREEIADFLRFAWLRASSRGPVGRRFGRLLVLMLRVGAQTGTRPGDLCCAWWSDFDPAKGSITLPPDRHKTGVKTGRPLTIFLGGTLVRALLRQRDMPGRHPVSIFTHQRTNGPGRGAPGVLAGDPWGKFVTRDGKPSFDDDSSPLSNMIAIIRREAIAHQKARRSAAIASGVPEDRAPRVTIVNEGDNRFVFYRLRHTVASDFLMKGGASATVAELLGTSTKMLDTVYGHLLEGHLREAADQLRSRKKAGS